MDRINELFKINPIDGELSMAYLTEQQLKDSGFKFVGRNVKVSATASIYNHEKIELSDNCRIDDFCVVSGHVRVGRFVHITPQCLVAGGEPGIVLEDYCTLAYGVKVFSQSDDYSGESMTNSLIPKKFKNEKFARTVVGKYSIIGAGATILPGADVAEGVALGAMSLLIKATEPWAIYAGVPARKIKERSKNLLKLADHFEKDSCDSV